ncbi:MAG: hypothetical protein MUE85_13610 [Microscillaceae bacterium]|jgi:hypothetical protein|nr:hypothetical protein [Microscillaceae bacterium]
MNTLDLKQLLEEYKVLQTESEKTAFLEKQKEILSQKSPAEIQAGIEAIAQRVKEIEDKLKEKIMI